MTRLLFLACLLASSFSCNAWQGTSSTSSSDWTWSCGDEDDDSTTRAPDSGCPMADAADGGT